MFLSSFIAVTVYTYHLNICLLCLIPWDVHISFIVILKIFEHDVDFQVVKMLLKLLEDKNGEVQNLAVKWYVLSRNAVGTLQSNTLLTDVTLV